MKDQDSVTIVRNSQMANASTFGGRRMKIILVGSLLIAGAGWLAGQNLDEQTASESGEFAAAPARSSS